MKNLLSVLVMCLFMIVFASCNAKVGKSSKDSGKDRVEVLYFHGKQRCLTCNAIEKNAKEAVDANFAKELKAGTVVFRVIDISDEKNEKIADKYEVTWSSLIVSKWKDGREQSVNMTDFAFGNARNNPDKFKSTLVEKIQKMLK